MTTIRTLLIVIVLILLNSCASKPRGSFEDQNLLAEPDYSQEKHWAALPDRIDKADRVPEGLTDGQANASVDVFFLHPTSYYGERKYRKWNAPIDDASVNESVDDGAILFQASAFNKAGKVYAPRYRQAHINVYYTKDKVNAKKALDLAYEDVKKAFAYYLKNYNNGRPFIIASHSQGTTHAARLIQEYIDDKPLENKLVAAYLLGIPVDLDKFKSLKACKSNLDTSCLIGWRTWKKGAKPKFLEIEKEFRVLNTNPLSWKTDTNYVPKEKNKGSVLLDFDAKPVPQLVDAQLYESILWVNKPKFKGSWLITSKNYHRGDVNLFYINIRENAADRAGVFLQTQ